MIQDIRKITDKEEYEKVLYKILVDFDERISGIRQFVLDSNVATPFILQQDGSVPKGYKQCDGKNGTYNLSGLEQQVSNGIKLVYIQKV